jgi:ribonuclease BN (tRNA processing enzyme)
MKLTFLGTKGYIDPSSRRHRMHSSMLVSYLGRQVMVDCGSTWRGKIDTVNPDAIVLTHFHPDHAAGIFDGVPCPVYAALETWDRVKDQEGIAHIDKRNLMPEKVEIIRGISFALIFPDSQA